MPRDLVNFEDMKMIGGSFFVHALKTMMAKGMLNSLPTTSGFVKILILLSNWSLFPVDI